MKKSYSVLLSIFTALALIPLAYAEKDGRKAQRKRQHHQEKRIREGVRSGELTKEEARKLQGEEHQIRKARKDAREDGTVTPEERKKIREMENKASKDIHEEKHDAEERPAPTQ